MKELMQNISSRIDFNKGIQADEVSIFVFSANWCPDCVHIKPFMPEIVETFSQNKFYYIDRDECIDICQDLGILGIPSFVAFKNGIEQGRLVSKLRKSKTEIIDFLNSVNERKDDQNDVNVKKNSFSIF